MPRVNHAQTRPPGGARQPRERHGLAKPPGTVQDGVLGWCRVALERLNDAPQHQHLMAASGDVPGHTAGAGREEDGFDDAAFFGKARLCADKAVCGAGFIQRTCLAQADGVRRHPPSPSASSQQRIFPLVFRHSRFLATLCARA